MISRVDQMTDYSEAKVVVVGAGAMGSLFGGLLAEGGLDMTLVDVWREHVDAINANGLSMVGHGGGRTIGVKATTEPSTIDRADVVFFQCKAIYNADAAASVKHLFDNGHTVAISFQNGLGNEEEIESILGAGKMLGGLTAQGANIEGPGVVRNHAELPSFIGEMEGGVSGRTRSLAKVFSEHGLPTEASEDIRHNIWKKLMANIGVSGTSAAPNLQLGEIVQVPELKAMAYRAIDEALAVAKAEGIGLDRDGAREVFHQITSGTSGNKSSLCVDIINERPSEVDYIYGSVIKLGEKHGIDTPVLQTISAVIKGLQSHYGA